MHRRGVMYIVAEYAACIALVVAFGAFLFMTVILFMAIQEQIKALHAAWRTGWHRAIDLLARFAHSHDAVLFFRPWAKRLRAELMVIGRVAPSQSEGATPKEFSLGG